MSDCGLKVLTEFRHSRVLRDPYIKSGHQIIERNDFPIPIYPEQRNRTEECCKTVNQEKNEDAWFTV